MDRLLLLQPYREEQISDEEFVTYCSDEESIDETWYLSECVLNFSSFINNS